MSKIICAGHASCDLALRTVDPNVFNLDTLHVEKINPRMGGDALNAGVALKRLGENPRYVAVVGDDVFGHISLNIINELGLDPTGVIIRNGVDSNVTCILIDSENERHFVCSGNAARSLCPDDILANVEAGTRYLHIGSFMSLDKIEYENAVYLFSRAKEAGLHTSFDVTFDEKGDWLKRIENALPYTDIMFASYDEAVSLTGGLTDPPQIARRLLDYGIGKCVIKLGKKGCYARDSGGDEFGMQAYAHMPVVDTTGAGDAFVGAFLFGMINGFSLKECCVIGNANGCLAISKLGANTGSATIGGMCGFLEEHGALGLNTAELIAKLRSTAI